MNRLIKYSLGTILTLVAINAFGGGMYGMMGAKELPASWLEGSFFHSYFIPGLILFSVVGGSSLLAAILVFINHPSAKKISTACSLILVIWIIVQLLVIGYVSWLQPVVLTFAFIILILSRLMGNSKP